MKEKDLISKFRTSIKNGNLDNLYEYIIKNNLNEEFVKQVFYDSFRKGYQGKEYDNAMDLSNFTMKVSMEAFKEKFGESLANKFSELVYNEQNPAKRNMEMQLLINQPVMKLEEANRVEQLLNVCLDKDNVVGLHITGAKIGQTLSDEGICLTGHKFTDMNGSKKSSAKLRLQENITFFENDPIGFITSFHDNRGYNNYGKNETNDFMIVSIPKKDLEGNNPDMIVEKDISEYLNPKYIKGFAKVGTERGEVRDIIDNPKFAQKESISDSRKFSTEEWKEQFESWYKESNTTKMQKVKEGVVNFFSKVLNKDKKKEIAGKEDSIRSDER